MTDEDGRAEDEDNNQIHHLRARETEHNHGEKAQSMQPPHAFKWARVRRSAVAHQRIRGGVAGMMCTLLSVTPAARALQRELELLARAGPEPWCRRRATPHHGSQYRPHTWQSRACLLHGLPDVIVAPPIACFVCF